WDYSKKMGPHIHGAPIVWTLPTNGVSYVYAWSERDHLRRFDYDNAHNAITPPTFSPSYVGGPQSAEAAPAVKMPGGALSLSANGGQLGSGVVWAVVENEGGVWGPRSGYFEAYAAATLGAPLFRDFIPMFAKFAAPTVANGHVYLPTFEYQLRVYGLRGLTPTPSVWDPGTFSFCLGVDHELLEGDFDGDGRGDLLCHGKTSGDLALALADKDGHYTSVAWSMPAAWCTHPTQSLKIGDFDGDGHADRWCHDTRDGSDWTAFADRTGSFGAKASQPAGQPNGGWCAAPDPQIRDFQIHVGDFDGDGRDDVLCHRPSTGEKVVRFTDPTGRF